MSLPFQTVWDLLLFNQKKHQVYHFELLSVSHMTEVLISELRSLNTQIYIYIFLPYASSCFAYLVCMLGTSIFPLFFFFFFSSLSFDDEINFRNPSSAKTFQIQLVPYPELQIMVLSEDFDKWRSMFYLVYWHFSQFLFFLLSFSRICSSSFFSLSLSFPFTLCLLQKPSCCTYT